MKTRLLTLLLLCLLSFQARSQYENTKIQLGEPAPALAFPNPDGELIHLKDLHKKKLVLIDFWASWCGPCRIANPHLVALYEEYKDKKFKGAKKGMTILSVSLDKNKESWIKAIEKDKLIWPHHISDLKAWDSEPAALYGIQFIPQAFLVDADGIVVAKFQSAAQMEEALKERLEGDKKKRKSPKGD